MEKPKCMIEVRDVYGLPRAYPRNDVADTFASLVGQQTLTFRTLLHIEELGYDIVFLNVAPAPKNFRDYRNANDFPLE